MKRLLQFFCLGFVFCTQVEAQQLPLWSEYLHNSFTINPAMMGWENITAFSVGYRHQWTDMPGAPRSASLSFQQHNEKQNMAYGGYFMHDQAGPVSFTGFNGVYAYQIPLAREKGKRSLRQRLSVGMSLSAIQYRLRANDLVYNDIDDPLIINQTAQKILPDAGLGVFYYDDRYFVGFSVPQLISMRVRFESDNALSNIRRIPHFYLNGGMRLKLPRHGDREHFLMPVVWAKYSPHAPLNVSLMLRYLWDYRFGFGLGYSTEGTFVADFSIQVQKRLRLGYAFSTPTRLASYLGTNHEIFLSYLLESNGKGWKFEEIGKASLEELIFDNQPRY